MRVFWACEKIILKTMGGINKKLKETAGKNKVVEDKQQNNITFQLLVNSESLVLNVNLKKLMSYLLTVLCHTTLEQ